MGFTKITNVELASRGATTLPNQPEISAQALKEEFDAPAKEIVAPKFNNLIDELEAGTAAASLGAMKNGQSTNVQACFTSIETEMAAIEAKIPEDAEDIQDAVNKRHTHDNKAVIDKFSEVGGNPYYDGNPIGGSVTVDSELSTSSENPVQNKVITNYLNSMGTPADLADAVAKKHSHSNKSVLDKLSEDSSGNPTYNGNVIPTTGQTGGFQKFIEHEILPPSVAGTAGDIMIAPATNDSNDTLYRYENSAWVEIKLAAGNPITYSNVDIQAGVTPLPTGSIYLVYE